MNCIVIYLVNKYNCREINSVEGSRKSAILSGGIV